MLAENRVARARLLFEHKRFDRCAEELRQALSQTPENAYVHSLLGLCLSNLGETTEAMRESREGIRLAPDTPYSYYVYTFVLSDQERYNEAIDAIHQAIRLAPHMAVYYGVLAGVCADAANWAGALEAAERGLALQADHLWCAKTRARALIRLGRLREALLAARQALALDPDDALSHTIMGWALLESRDARLALPHFHTALRLSPDSSWALEGAMRARKERALFFRAVVAPIKRFVELPDWALWTLLVACWFGAHLTPRTISAYPSWKVPVVALLVIYLLLHLIRRAADPLLNVLVRSYRFTGGNTAVWSCPRSWTLTESLYMASLTFLPLSLIWRPGVVLSYIADFAFLLALAADAGKIITGQRSIHPAALIPVGTLMLILASLRG